MFQKQIGMTCGKYAVAMALSILHGKPIDGDSIIGLLGKINRYSVAWYSGFGSFMYQVNRLTNDIGKSSGLNHSASLANPTVDEYKVYLSDPNSVVVVTVTGSQQPEIYKGDSSIPKPWDGTGHVMVLVAFDETHKDSKGVVRPWGLLSSWDNGNDPAIKSIYWMSDAEFQRTNGNHSTWSAVIISSP